jgi:hypothetical protein
MWPLRWPVSGCQVLVVDENTDDGVAAFYGASVPAGDLQQVVERRQVASSEVVLTRSLPGSVFCRPAGLVQKLARLERCSSSDTLIAEHAREIVPPADVVLVDTSLGHPLASRRSASPRRRR